MWHTNVLLIPDMRDVLGGSFVVCPMSRFIAYLMAHGPSEAVKEST